jgi:hypothetical protein
MIRLLSALALTTLTALPATAESTAYGNEGGCNRMAGKPEGTDAVAIFRPGERIEFWESSCPILGSTMVGAGATVVTVECSGEGETWEAYYMLETLEGDGFVLYPEDAPDNRTELHACQ